jgi:acyl carrier protein
MLADLKFEKSEFELDEPLTNFMDSLDLVELQMMIEEEFKMQIEFEVNMSLSDLIKIIGNKGMTR